MNIRVRMVLISDQDRWRREDMRCLSPNERVDLLLQMQQHYRGDQAQHIKRVATIRTNRAEYS
jgi:hypothetical protein